MRTKTNLVTVDKRAVRNALEDAGMSQGELALKMGMSQSNLSRIITGEKQCELPYLKLMSSFLNVKEDTLKFNPIKPEAHSDVNAILANNEVLNQISNLQKEIKSLTEDVKIFSLMMSNVEASVKEMNKRMEDIEAMNQRTVEINATASRIWSQMKPKAKVTYESRGDMK